MDYLIRVLHGFGAIAVGFYLLLPFITGKLASLKGDSLRGFTKVMFSLNRIGQYILIFQFISGGYLISQAQYTWTWIIVVLAVFLIVGALPGVMGSSFKRILKQDSNETVIQQSISRVSTLSILISICLLILIFMMYYPAFR